MRVVLRSSGISFNDRVAINDGQEQKLFIWYDRKYLITPHGRTVLRDKLPSELTYSWIKQVAAKERVSSLQIIGELLEQSSGLIQVIDPFFGHQTLTTLFPLEAREVQFLTSTISDPPPKKDLNSFLEERTNQQIRVSKSKVFHDRFVLVDEGVLQIGHGLKDVGTKISFLSFFPKNECAEVYESLRKDFSNLWNEAVDIRQRLS